MLPQLSYSSAFRIVILIGILFIIFNTIVNEFVIFKSIDVIILKIAFFIFYLVYTLFIFEESAKQHIQLFIFLLLSYSSIYLVGSRLNGEFIIVIILSLLIVTQSITIIELRLSPEVARLLSHSSELGKEYASRGVGGYGFIYMNVLMFPLILMLRNVIKNRQIKYKLVIRGLLYTTIALTIILIILAGYSTAIILIGSQLFLILTKRLGRSRFKFLIILIFAPILFVVSISFIVNIKESLLVFSEGTFYEQKLNDIFYFFDEKETIGTVAGRSDRFLLSFTSFLKHPLFGSLNSNEVGNHSTLLDLFGKFGIIISILFLTILYDLFIFFNKLIDKDNYLFYIFYLSLIVLSIVNTIGLAMAMPFIFLASILLIKHNETLIKL